MTNINLKYDSITNSIKLSTSASDVIKNLKVLYYSMDNTGRRLSQTERILLHLFQFGYDPGSYTTPHTLCQDGIGDALDILKNNVSRGISKLKSEELIEERLARVKGFSRRRNIYLLTDKGKDVCRKLLDEIRDNEIRFMDEGTVITVTLREAVERSKEDFTRIDPFHIEEWMRKRDVFDPREFVPYHTMVKNKKEVFQQVIGAPLVEDIYGREDELSDMHRRLSAPDPPIIVISGIAGIGKSSLASKAMEGLRENRSIFWHTFHPWDSLSELRGEINSFFKMSSGKNLKREGLYGIFAELSDSVREPVLFLDNCEKVPADIRNIFGILLELKKRGAGFGAVLMSREKMSFYDVRDVLEERVMEIELGPLGEEDVKKMLARTGKDSAHIYQKTRGHPLYVEIYQRYQGDTVTMEDFIEHEIYSKLTRDEKELMKRLSVLWDTADRDIVLGPGETDLITELKSAHLVEVTVDDTMGVHALLKDHIYGRLPIKEKKKLHADMGKRMAEVRKHLDLEILYHYEMGGRWKEALEALDTLKPIVASLHQDDRAKLIDFFPHDLLPEKYTGRYHECLGDIHLQAKEWNGAVAHYERAMKHMGRTPELIEKIGDAQKNLRRWKETIESHREAIRRYREKEDAGGEVREILALGTVYRKMGDLYRSESMYKKAEGSIRRRELKDALGALYNNLGMLSIHKNDYRGAESYFKKALKAGGEYGIIHGNLADLYRKMGEREKEIKILSRMVEHYLEKGLWGEVSKTYLRLGRRLAAQGNVEKALDSFEKGLKAEVERGRRILPFGKREMSPTEMEIRNELADILRGTDEDTCLEHRKTVMEHLTRKGDTLGASKTKLRYVFDLHDSGKMKLALKELDELEKSLNEQVETSGLIASDLERARIYMDMGRYHDAQKLLKDIILRARKVGDKDAEHHARELLDSGYSLSRV